MTAIPSILQVQNVRVHATLLEPWMLAVFLLLLVGHAWIKTNYPNRIGRLFRAFVNTRLMRQMMREELSLMHRGSIVLSLAFVMSMALALYEIPGIWYPSRWSRQGIQFYFVILGSILLVYLLKLLGIWLMKNITQGDFSLSDYKFTIFLHNKLLGVVLLPLIILLSTTPLFYYNDGQLHPSIWAKILALAIIIVAFGAYLTRIIRGITTARQIKVPSVYIIFYLCTLEFLPIALFIKYLNI